MTDETREQGIVSHLVQSREVLHRAIEDRSLIESMLAIADAITRAFRAGGKLMLAGNGGSAGDAQHIAGELAARLNFDRSPLPAIALSTDTSVLTAIGNDYGYDRVFERQVRALGRPDDVLLAISTSGRSPNIIAALQAARDMRLLTIGFTGNGVRAMTKLCDLTLAAPSDETPHIQQIHITAAHAICSLVERDLFGARAQKPNAAPPAGAGSP
jgi:D-sedoheptulose 7-phosphate isomerase